MLDLIGVPRYPALAKMDIERSELAIIREMLILGKGEELPEQFAMEVHSLGYKLVHRADNPYCTYCSEVTLVKNDRLPGAS